MIVETSEYLIKKRTINREYYHRHKDELRKKGREFYQANREQIREQAKAYRDANKEKLAAQRHESYLRNRETKLAKDREYYQENKGRIAERGKEYRQRNAEKIRAQDKEDYAKNREAILAKNKENYQKNRSERIRKQREYHEENREEILKRQRAAHRTDPRKHMWHSAKKRAQQFGLPFLISIEDIVVPEFCPALGLRLEVGGKSGQDASPSLDRIIPELGYVPGNVAVISRLANSIKHNATPEQVRAVADWMDRVVSR
jgi:hypothetical protein